MAVAQIITLFFTIYQMLITFSGMFKEKKRMKIAKNFTEKYALIVCAHNEAMVIGKTIHNLLDLDYPRELYDIYVTCDNCTDDTADIVRMIGGIALERFNNKQKGKGYALEWTFNQLWKMEDQGITYNGIAVFDADNLVSRNILKCATAKLRSGFDVIQVYLDSKNPSDTWITKSYAYAYWVTNRNYQLARENIGLSAQLGGTGMIFKSSLLKEMGWGAKSLTEDLEFTVRYIIQHGKRVGWIHEAKIFDEKPLKMKQSWNQRMRWMQGHFACTIKYSGQLIRLFIKKPKLLYFDALVYLIQPTKIVLAMAGLVFYLLSLFSPLPPVIQNWVLNPWIWFGVLLLFYLQPFVGLIMENKLSKIWWAFSTYIFSISWIPIVFIAFFRKNNTTWSHTKHTRAMNANEVLESVNTHKKRINKNKNH